MCLHFAGEDARATFIEPTKWCASEEHQPGQYWDRAARSDEI